MPLERGCDGARGHLWCLVLGFVVLPATAQYGGGTGTAGDPYLIFTAEQLVAAGRSAADADKHFRLEADIDLAAHGPLESGIFGTPDVGAFTGVFDGNGKIVANLQVQTPYGSYLGLFGLVSGASAQVMNVTLVDPNVGDADSRYVAPLVATLRDGRVTNCHVRCGRVVGSRYVGGLIGMTESGAITGCTVTAAVRGSTNAGGLIGYSYFGQVANCRARGEVLGMPETSCWSLGGLVGASHSSAVTNCCAACTVVGGSYAGGLVGDNLIATVGQCLAEGEVSGGHDVGGLVGRNRGGTIVDSYSLADTTGIYNVGGLVGRLAPSCDCSGGTPGLVARCYAAGPVEGAATLGGLIALNEDSIVEDSFWDIDVTGRRSSAGGFAGTTAQMSNPATYLAAGRDFLGEQDNGSEDVWTLPSPKAYPRLAWQPTPGDFDADGDVDLRDFARLARRWRQIDDGFWSAGTCIAPDTLIDSDDLYTLSRVWLTGVR
jgi:hypothetical protein